MKRQAYGKRGSDALHTLRQGEMHEGSVVAAYIAAIFNVIVCFGIPLGAIAYYLVRDRARAAVFGLGVLSFFVSQVVLRSAMLNALNGTVEFAVFSATRPLLHMLFLALTAAVFEETARLLFLRPQRKNTFDVGVAVAFGMGHGGCEAMIVGLNSAALLIAPLHLIPIDASIAMAGVERVSTLMIHVALSVLVYAAIMRRNAWPFITALALHTAVDALVFAPHYLPISGWAFEVLLFIISVVILALSLRWAHSHKLQAAAKDVSSAADAKPNRT